MQPVAIFFHSILYHQKVQIYHFFRTENLISIMKKDEIDTHSPYHANEIPINALNNISNHFLGRILQHGL